jgi:hypothetical protein
VSLRALRRSAIAASSVLALGGTLAIASSASAASIPFGTPTSSGETSIYGLLNTSYAGLANGAYFLTEVVDSAVPQNAGGVSGDTAASPGYPAATTFPTETGTTPLSTAQALQIAADFSGAAVTSGSTTTQPTSATYGAEIKGAFESTYGMTAGDTEYATISAELTTAAQSWDQLSAIVGNLYNDDTTDFPNNPLFSIDSDLVVSSTATVSAKGVPNAYAVTLGTAGTPAAAGYVLPSLFTMTFPSDFLLNDSLVGHEITAAQESSPPAVDAIGTFSIVSPAAQGFGLSTTDKISNSIYVASVPSPTDPSLELYLGSGVFMLGQFPTKLSFPLTMTFNGVNASALNLSSAEAIPFQSIALSFPASTSPVEAQSCSSLGSDTGTATDEVSALAAEFGDTTDSGAVAIPGSATVVTDECKAIGSKGTLKVKKTKGKVQGTLALTIAGDSGTAFTSATIKLPTGVTDKGKKSVTEKFGATAKKSIKLTGLKLTKKAAKAKSDTVTFTVTYSENGTTAASTAATAKLKA